MNTKTIFQGVSMAVALLIAAFASSSCMTTYDAYGRPVQSVDPGAAAAGAAAAGVLGYAIGRDSDDNDRRYDDRSRHRHYGHDRGRRGGRHHW
ncbi:MAG: hypothetical protein KDN05_19890 [Verrucomicrobiae bacterium]|nr:hypothetical protein [Verrucomicrobiae bacterium]